MENQSSAPVQNKNKKMMIIGGIVGAVLLVFALGYFMLVPASAEKTCDHFVDKLGVKGSSKKELTKSCVKDMEKNAEKDGLFKTRSYRSCILDSKNIQAMVKCDDKRK